jgi:hypothetical protein
VSLSSQPDKLTESHRACKRGVMGTPQGLLRPFSFSERVP